MLRTNSRKETYHHLAKWMQKLDDTNINSLLVGEVKTQGWSKTQIIELEGSKVFVKKIPLTKKEFESSYSTKNLYHLPTHFNYGVGSAGISPFRELNTHIKTTDWVLTGQIENFPLLYHYRILPCSDEKSVIDEKKHSEYISEWDNNQNIDEYIIEKKQADYEIILFLECIPHSSKEWIIENSFQIPLLIDQIFDTIMFLKKNGLSHFDPHLDNIITDGETIYLTDFGLTMDKEFELSSEEQHFLKENINYDYACFLFSIYATVLLAKSKESNMAKLVKFGLTPEMNSIECYMLILRNFKEVIAEKITEFDQAYVDMVYKYHDVIHMYGDFFNQMVKNHQKDTTYNSSSLASSLEKLGII